MFANTRMMEKGSDSFPDTCQSPSPTSAPVPIPYPNVGRPNDTVTVCNAAPGETLENDPGAAPVPSQARVVVLAP